MNVAFTQLAIDALNELSGPEQSKALHRLYRFKEGDLSDVKRLTDVSDKNLYFIRVSKHLRLLTIIAGTQALIIDSLNRGTKLFEGVRDTILEYAAENELYELTERNVKIQDIEDAAPGLTEKLKKRLIPDNAVDSWKTIQIIAKIILMTAGTGFVLSHSDIKINIGPLIDINEIKIHINKEVSRNANKPTGHPQNNNTGDSHRTSNTKDDDTK